MELSIILSQIENENEEEIERLLHEYNTEVRDIVALLYPARLTLASKTSDA